MGAIGAIGLLLFGASCLPYIAIANYIAIYLGLSGIVAISIIFIIIELIGLSILMFIFRNFTVSLIVFLIIGLIIVFNMGDNIWQYLPKEILE